MSFPCTNSGDPNDGIIYICVAVDFFMSASSQLQLTFHMSGLWMVSTLLRQTAGLEVRRREGSKLGMKYVQFKDACCFDM